MTFKKLERETRLSNKKGIEISNQLNKAKAVTAMYHFNEFGCKIGKTTLEKKREV